MKLREIVVRVTQDDFNLLFFCLAKPYYDILLIDLQLLKQWLLPSAQVQPKIISTPNVPRISCLVSKIPPRTSSLRTIRRQFFHRKTTQSPSHCCRWESQPVPPRRSWTTSCAWHCPTRRGAATRTAAQHRGQRGRRRRCAADWCLAADGRGQTRSCKERTRHACRRSDSHHLKTIFEPNILFTQGYTFCTIKT